MNSYDGEIRKLLVRVINFGVTLSVRAGSATNLLCDVGQDT